MEPLFKVGDVVTNEYGETGRVICNDRIGEQPIVVLINVCGVENAFFFCADGSYLANGSKTSFDLLPPEKVVWVNVYANGRSCSHNTRADADIGAVSGRVARKKVVYRPGDMDE